MAREVEPVGFGGFFGLLAVFGGVVGFCLGGVSGGGLWINVFMVCGV